MEKWIIKSEAVYYTGKSVATINRYIAKHKNNRELVKFDNDKPFLNTEKLKANYPFINDMQMNANENILHQKDFAELTLQKQEKDIINKLIERQHKPFFRLPVVWVSIGFIILFVLAGSIGYLYRTELINNHQTQVKNLNVRIDELKGELKETRTAYSQSQKSIDALYQKYNSALEASNKLLAMKEQEYKAKLDALKKAPEAAKN